MSYYNAVFDDLYDETVMVTDILKLVDIIRHSAWVIKNRTQRPVPILGTDVRLHNTIGYYQFFSELWANKQEIECPTNKDLKGLKLSELHIAAILYAMRQNYFIKPDPSGSGNIIGWHINPQDAYLGSLPDIFEDFEQTYTQFQALGLQGRYNAPILGHLSNSVSRYVQRHYNPGEKPYKEFKIPPP